MDTVQAVILAFLQGLQPSAILLNFFPFLCRQLFQALLQFQLDLLRFTFALLRIRCKDHAQAVRIIEQIRTQALLQKAAFGDFMFETLQIIVQIQNTDRVPSMQPVADNRQQQF